MLNADVNNLKLEISDGTETNLTTTADVSSAPVGSFIGKTADVTTAINYKTSAAASIIENSNYRTPQVSFLVMAKTGTDTYIRCNVD